MKEIKLFDYYNAMTQKSEIDLSNIDDNKSFSSFVLIRFLSQNQGDTLVANEINSRPHMDNRLKMDFFINTLRKRYRKASGFKYQIPQDIELIMEFYNYSQSKAKEIRSLFNDEDMDKLRLLTNKGGINGERN